MRLLIDAILWLASRLPQPLVPGTARGLGLVLHRIIRFRRARIIRHLQLAFPELDQLQRRRLLSRIYRHFGYLLVELLRLPRQSRENLLEQSVFEGLDNLELALARGRGVFILAAHLGNWEWGLAAASEYGLPVATVTKEIKGSLGQYMADRIRHPHGVVTVNRRNAIRPIVAQLRKRGIVVFVLDQNMTAKEGIFVDFFGRPACTMSALAVLAKRYRVPVVPIKLFRDEAGMHHVRFSPELAWQPVADGADDGGESEVRQNTQIYTSWIEQAIREHPEQWLWMHGRWRTQPAEGD